jgi:hypothetical protein
LRLRLEQERLAYVRLAETGMIVAESIDFDFDPQVMIDCEYTIEQRNMPTNIPTQSFLPSPNTKSARN